MHMETGKEKTIQKLNAAGSEERRRKHGKACNSGKKNKSSVPFRNAMHQLATELIINLM